MNRGITSALAALMMLTLTACSSVPANKVNSADDLTGKSIGVQQGTTGDIFASDVENAKVMRYNKGADAVAALKDGKVDAVIIDEEPAKVFISGDEGLRILDESFAVEEYAIAVSKDNEELLDALNSTLSEMQSDGTLDSIRSNWIADETGSHPYITPEGTDHSKGTLTMATNAEFPPYESLSGEAVVGIDVDIMRCACDRMGMELKIENMDFDKIIPAVMDGTADAGVAGITVTPEREEKVVFTIPYTTSTQVIIVRS
ncbi:MAG: transporter substrate-binding domain-containing protein [Oscillospiraceae bacterium]|nr:transporter substrate-binding domain-containing protein [Oscillospiraceae bacterium]